MTQKTLERSKLPDPSRSSVSLLRITTILVLAAFVVGLDVYYPALRGPFVFDDFVLPYPYHSAREQPLFAWMSGVRPVLMFTFWLNDKISGKSPAGYHMVNLLIHVVNTGLVFLVLNRLVEMSARVSSRARIIASIIGAAIFLVHPLQTESVSYIAGRSESLAGLFVLLAYVVFLYRRHECISWVESLAVLALFGIAVAAKENAVCLAGVLILTDVFWPKPFSARGLRNNWRLYAAMVPGVVAATWKIFEMLSGASSAGFSVSGITWYQYGFTQARAFFTYLRLALFPVGQSIDHDYAISHTILEHGAVFYLAALAVLVGLCVRGRRRYPLACFGLLLTLVLLAPTSSIVPIIDPLVERRMYLPLIGLILIGCEVATRIRLSALTGYTFVAAIVFVLAVLCYQRNTLWARPSRLWAAAAMESTGKGRPYANLVRQLVQERRCRAAIPYLQHAERVLPNDYDIMVAWSQVYECLGHREEAMGWLQRAAQVRPDSHSYQLIGLLYGEMGKRSEAGDALQKAVRLDPRSVPAHNALALWYESVKDLANAEREYVSSLAIDPGNRTARTRLVGVRRAQSFH